MPNPDVATLTRQELYDKVWSTPMRTLARTDGLSDVGLAQLARRGYKLVMVTNQDGLGTQSFPQAHFDGAHTFILEAFRSQGIEFDAVFVCPHFKTDNCECRKPRTQLVETYVREKDMDATASAMIGDRDTDLEFARNLGIRGLKVHRNGTPDETWPAIVRELTARRARHDRSWLASPRDRR